MLGGYPCISTISRMIPGLGQPSLGETSIPGTREAPQ